jgi:hypothetical protein
MKKVSLKFKGVVIASLIYAGFSFNTISCPENYNLDNAALLPTTNGLVLHCGMAGLQVCCKKNGPESLKREP